MNAVDASVDERLSVPGQKSLVISNLHMAWIPLCCGLQLSELTHVELVCESTYNRLNQNEGSEVFTGGVIVLSDFPLLFPSLWINFWPIDTQDDQGGRAHIEHNTTEVDDAVLERERHPDHRRVRAMWTASELFPDCGRVTRHPEAIAEFQR